MSIPWEETSLPSGLRTQAGSVFRIQRSAVAGRP
jgi:hypothetical protein